MPELFEVQKLDRSTTSISSAQVTPQMGVWQLRHGLPWNEKIIRSSSEMQYLVVLAINKDLSGLFIHQNFVVEGLAERHFYCVLPKMLTKLIMFSRLPLCYLTCS